MAASISPETRDPATADRYRLLRELGTRSVPTYAAELPLGGGKSQLVVVERLARGGAVSDEEASDFVRDARRVAELEHPNIARVKDVAIRAEDVIVVSEFVDGERLAELTHVGRTGKLKIPLEIVLRILVDVLTGLGALHNLRDVKRQPLHLVHGELTTTNIVVGVDGSSRILHVCRVRSAAMRPGRAGSGYLAPEILLADGSADQRSDIYSVGALLWEALSGKALFPDTNPHTIVAHLLSGKVSRPSVPDDAPWAADLAPLAERALAADPKKRFATAAEMAAELRRVAGTKLATTGRVASFMKASFGEKITARRAKIEATKQSISFPSSSSPSPTEAPTVPPPAGEEGWDIAIDEEPAAPLAQPKTAPVAFTVPAAAIPPHAAAPPAPAKSARAKWESAPELDAPAQRAVTATAPGAQTWRKAPPPMPTGAPAPTPLPRTALPNPTPPQPQPAVPTGSQPGFARPARTSQPAVQAPAPSQPRAAAPAGSQPGVAKGAAGSEPSFARPAAPPVPPAKTLLFPAPTPPQKSASVPAPVPLVPPAAMAAPDPLGPMRAVIPTLVPQDDGAPPPAAPPVPPARPPMLTPAGPPMALPAMRPPMQTPTPAIVAAPPPPSPAPAIVPPMRPPMQTPAPAMVGAPTAIPIVATTPPIPAFAPAGPTPAHAAVPGPGLGEPVPLETPPRRKRALWIVALVSLPCLALLIWGATRLASSSGSTTEPTASAPTASTWRGAATTTTAAARAPDSPPATTAAGTPPAPVAAGTATSASPRPEAPASPPIATAQPPATGPTVVPPVPIAPKPKPKPTYDPQGI